MAMRTGTTAGAVFVVSVLCTFGATSGGPAVAEDAPDALVARGDYLVNSILACGNCHTPMGPEGPDFTRALSGGLQFDEPPFTVSAPNLTADPTGLGEWSDEEIRRALVEGLGRDGRPLAPVMPYSWYNALSERDLSAVIAYLRTVPAVEHTVPDPVYRVVIHTPPAPGAEAPIPKEARTDPVSQGHYLATIGHCMECHTARLEDGLPDFAGGWGRGGMAFPGPWGISVAANITQDPEWGIGAWTDEEIARAITQGISHDGTPLFPPMAFGYYARMTDEDVAALVAWLRTVPPLQ